jgi:HD-GYP domain-containing protein (c-di-GMP phosphodiesterase class II)
MSVMTEINRDLLRSLLVMGSVVEARDTYTGGHQWRVAQYAKLLGEHVGLSEEDLFILTLGGFIHDLGKVGVPDAILLKEEALDDGEFAFIRTHPQIGVDILRGHPLLDLVGDIILHHHEWMDGRGYPESISVEDVTPLARLTAVADSFDAMTSTRPYRKGMPVEDAVVLLEERRGTQWDPAFVDPLAELARAGRLDHIVRHSDEGMLLVECPRCGPVIAIPRTAREGDTVLCRCCAGKFHLHRAGETFEAEFWGERGGPDELRPQPDMAPIEDLVKQAPKAMTG